MVVGSTNVVVCFECYLSVADDAQLAWLRACVVGRMRWFADGSPLLQHTSWKLFDEGQWLETEAERLKAEQVVAIRAWLSRGGHHLLLSCWPLQHDWESTIFTPLILLLLIQLSSMSKVGDTLLFCLFKLLTFHRRQAISRENFNNLAFFLISLLSLPPWPMTARLV